MPQIKLACRLAFWNLRKNHKKFQLGNSIFPSRNAEAAFTRALMGLRRFVLNNLVDTVYFIAMMTILSA